MDALRDGGFDAIPPPVGGLGNFKGVMLCNRPVDDSTMKQACDGPQPFKSMISATHNEQLGLPPCKNFERSVKTRGPSAALRRHVRWLKELQEEMRNERDQAEAEGKMDEERKQRMKAFFEKQREGVRQMIAESTGPLAKEKEKKTQVQPSKPLWAMTEREKDNFEEEEADKLINFAEELDFDKYMGDLEFRQGLDALKDRAGKLQKEQEAFKDALVRDYNATIEQDEDDSTRAGSPRLEDGLEGASVLGDLRSEYSATSSKRREQRTNREGGLDWDSSTACGDERQDIEPGMKDAIDRVLESAPQMRAIHSKSSVQKIIQRARDAREDHDEAAPVPVIVVSSDMQNRLHKPVDPSCLPYLYRSPAV